ncbi:four helix bundle protein [Dysgonomonas sp. 521]|uniref:four helix bundle protein n=1 Tax=Dysgonomonas sp. 521 TaxID=2302932 RepID=UPI0013CF4EF4|nr:four helix bundle protein [Dysgonomonas sp. 521]NDV96320.1 four helix bundle protein [Dysgonomonas sp. 521]
MNEKVDNIIETKSFNFAVRIIRLYKLLIQERKEFVLSKQLLRSGTAIGALVKEAINAESKADFIHKLGIAQKECGESIYWIELLKETEFIDSKEFNAIFDDANEILKILRSIIISSKKTVINS